MGQLSKHIPGLHKKHVRQIVLAWLLPVVLALSVLFLIHAQVKADPAPTASELAQYLQNHQLNLGTEVVNGYQQVYYVYNGQNILLTSENYNHANAIASGEYVVWEGSSDIGSIQIYQYDVLTDVLIQVTAAGTNEDPCVSGDTITWETWDGSQWQVMYYNGAQVQQITSGPNASVYASTNGKQIIYAEQIASDDWKAQSYDVGTGQTTTIREGDTTSTAYPQFASDGSISTAYTAH
jgi:hypothetical protein